ncbi:hypothetical protein EX30DRAFT_340491 [Ascodesmis nigricans]|uniref:Uncharacterized protein n=1 Tax=Ascodesmis nigricans TaxID=341454 RepID=A0A4S2MYC8_9PEZI|nr:hypothetical protein EX30DRAFT_340491 [Ascodesmis nigricans]
MSFPPTPTLMLVSFSLAEPVRMLEEELVVAAFVAALPLSHRPPSSEPILVHSAAPLGCWKREHEHQVYVGLGAGRVGTLDWK